MFKHEITKDISWTVSLNWFMLAFAGGAINAGGFLACGRFVSHLTGFGTLFGVEAASGRLDIAVGILSVPLFFLMGTMISGYLIDRPFHRGREPHYATVMSLAALCLILAAFLGHYHFFGEFGAGVRLRRDYFFLALLCLASGLQNAALTTSSGSTVRTTHLTGITTDLGIGLIRAMTLIVDRKEHALEMKATRVRVGIIVFFYLGSLVAAILYFRVGYLGFLLPAGILCHAMLVAKTSYSKASGSGHRIATLGLDRIKGFAAGRLGK